MIRTLGLLLLAGGLATARAEEPKKAEEKDPVKIEQAKLQGTWVVESAERDGEALDRIVGNKLVIKDNGFAVITKNGEFKGTFTVDPSKKPKQLDMNHDEGGLRDKKWEAIYKLDGDTLTYCYAEADSEKERPDAFETRKDSRRLLIVLKRKAEK